MRNDSGSGGKSRIVDKNGRLFGKISLIDLLFIAVIIVLAAAIYIRVFSDGKVNMKTSGSDTFTYEMTVFSVREYTLNAMQIGDELYDDNDVYIGKITGIESEQSETYNSTYDGKFEKGVMEGRYDINLTVEASGKINKGHYYASGVYEVGANMVVYFHSLYVVSSGTVTNVY